MAINFTSAKIQLWVEACGRRKGFAKRGHLEPRLFRWAEIKEILVICVVSLSDF